MKKIIMYIFIGFVLIIGTVVVAATLNASEINYKNNKNVNEALDDLYTKVSSSSPAITKFCELKEGTAYAIGSKYECDPGDGVKRIFFVLSEKKEIVKLVMEHNITEGSDKTVMNYQTAAAYFKTGDGVSTKNAWTNVIEVDLPESQDVANAVGNTSWIAESKYSSDWFYLDKNGDTYGKTQVANENNLSNYRWLFNYTTLCASYGCDSDTSLDTSEAYGYWAKDRIFNDIGYAWAVGRSGTLDKDPTSNAYLGVRPVITVLKGNLSN